VNVDLRDRTRRKALATPIDAAAEARSRRQLPANTGLSFGVAISSPKMRHQGRRKNGHTFANGARTGCREIKTLASVAVESLE
jgi:hypothetical protein